MAWSLFLREREEEAEWRKRVQKGGARRTQRAQSCIQAIQDCQHDPTTGPKLAGRGELPLKHARHWSTW